MPLRLDSSRDHRSLFPLPLAPFEAMMLYDDRPDYPMMCAAEFTFDGELDRGRFEAAFEAARQRHPLFCAHIAYQGRRPQCWVPSSARPHIHYVDGNREASPAEIAPLDLRVEVGVRLTVATAARQTRLLFDFHHACTDGVGGLSFVEDVLACYRAAMEDRPLESSLPMRQPESLLRRSEFPGASGFSLRRLYNECCDLRETLRFFGQRPQMLAALPFPRLRIVSDRDAPRLVSRTLEPAFLASLRGLAAASQVTVNDLLVRALFLTVRDWNAARCRVDGDDCLRILTPASLRTREHLPMPAANRLSYSFFTRSFADLDDPAQLLAWLQAETARIRRARVPERILSKMGILHAIAGGLPYVLGSRQCLATAVLSNVGDPTRRFQTRFPRDRGRLVAGNLVLTGFTAMTPLRPNTRATFFVNTYANQLTVSARLDPQFFLPGEGSQILDQLTGHLAAQLGTGHLCEAA